MACSDALLIPLTLERWHTVGNVLLTGSQDGTVWMWEATAGTCMQVRVSFSRSSDRVQVERFTQETDHGLDHLS